MGTERQSLNFFIITVHDLVDALVIPWMIEGIEKSDVLTTLRSICNQEMTAPREFSITFMGQECSNLTTLKQKLSNWEKTHEDGYDCIQRRGIIPPSNQGPIIAA